MNIDELLLDSFVKNYAQKQNLLEIPQNNIKEFQSALDYNEIASSIIDTEQLASYALPKSLGILTSQKVSLSVSQLNNSLQPVENTIVEVNSIFIENIELNLGASGFTGDICFNLPYVTSVPEEYGILFENQPLQVELTVISEYREDQTNPPPQNKSTNQTVKLKGIASLKKSIDHLHYFIDKRQQDIRLKNKSYFRSYVQVKLSFCDVLQCLWDDHYQVSIYTNQSYQQVFESINKTYASQVTLKYIDSAKALNLLRPFISVNCDVQRDYSLYDFLIKTLSEYGLSLFYDYSKQQYNITDAQTWLNKLELKKLDAKHRSYIKEMTVNNSLLSRDIEILNTHYDLSSSTNIKSKPNQAWQESTSALPAKQSCHLINKGVKSDAEIAYKASLSNQDQSTVTIVSDIAALYDCPVQPISLFQFDDVFKPLTLKQKGFPSLLLKQTCWNIKPTPLWSNMRRYWGATQERLNSEGKHDLSRSLHKNDDVNKRPPLLFNYNIRQKFCFKEHMTIVLPRLPKTQPDLKVIAQVYTTKDDLAKKTNNHLLFDMYKSQVVNVSNVADDSLYTAGQFNSPYAQSYLLHMPKNLLPPNDNTDPLLIPMNVHQANTISNYYALLKAGTEIKVSIQAENVCLQQIISYKVPDDIFTKGDQTQNHYLNFENNDDLNAYISHEYDLSNKSSTLNIESSLKEQVRQLKFSDTQIQMKYKLKS